MKVGLVGVGQAGGKIVETIVEHTDQTNNDVVADAMVVNTAKADLVGLDSIPLDARVLIGQSRVKGHGAGADNVLGAAIADEDIDDVLSTVANFPISEVEAFIIVAALGGGTGSGGAPVIARELSRIYEEPVYGLGVLPDKEEGGIYQLNAARSFVTFVNEVDNLLVFDNAAWRRGGESVRVAYEYTNGQLAQRLDTLLSAGQPRTEAAESVVDSSEIINTFAAGGVSTIGYASADLQRAHGGLLAQFSSKRPADTGDPVSRILTTTRQATLGRLTLPCEISSAERALLVVAGPPDVLDRRGIERAIGWLEEQTGTMEVRGGDYPLPRASKLTTLVLLSGVSDVPRLKQLQAVAVETKQNLDQIREESPKALQEMIWSGSDSIEPLY
jgi:cell division GTPase FtsZ